MKELAPIRDRIEALAAEALEDVVQEAEARDEVKVIDVVVHVADTPVAQPSIDVSVTVKQDR